MSEIYKGAAKQIDDIDLPRIGAEIGVGEDPIHALLEVETSGDGFDHQGRVKMLFEPHVFYRLLKGPERERAVSEGLAYPKWGTRKYPRDSYPRLDQAMAINPTAALKACSWGLGQVMGSNHVAAGYETVEDMVRAFADDEETHLQAMINFIIANNIDDDLQRIQKIIDAGKTPTARDWIPIVRVYNGAGYAKNDYHNRAARALVKWMRIKDTPWAKNTKLKDMAAMEQAEHEATSEVHEPEGSSEVALRSENHEILDAKPSSSVVTSAQPEAEGSPPPAQEIKASQPSLLSRLSALSMPTGGVLGIFVAIWKFAQSIPPWGWVVIGGCFCITLIIGAWLFNESMKRADSRTHKLMDAAADKLKNNLRIV